MVSEQRGFYCAVKKENAMGLIYETEIHSRQHPLAA